MAKQANAQPKSWGVGGVPAVETLCLDIGHSTPSSVFVFVFKYQPGSSVAFVLGLDESGQATFPFNIHKVRLLLTRLCCCQSPGRCLELGPRTRGWLCPGLSPRNCRRKRGRTGVIIITANLDEALSSSQVSFQTLCSVLNYGETEAER